MSRPVKWPRFAGAASDITEVHVLTSTKLSSALKQNFLVVENVLFVASVSNGASALVYQLLMPGIWKSS